ncbi:MAG: hypothetical protein LBP53_04800 [Candidatus Peribacteria bacterium]|jgi:hypothetical protein|nr:hypothetical protein [Candidatus Peribacteria bacterium]
MVVAGSVLVYVYYFISSPTSTTTISTIEATEKNVDESSGAVFLATGDTNSAFLPSSLHNLEEEFYADLSDLIDVNENFYEDIQGEYGFTSS